jgi:hypothetical protein
MRTRLNSDAGIVHVTADMREDLGLEAELADCLAICPRLLWGGRRCQFNVFHAESIQRLCDGDFGFGVEESVRKLFALYRDGE